MNKELVELLGDGAKSLLEHKCTTVSKDTLHLPGPDFVDRVWAQSDRNNQVLGNLERLHRTGRLGGSGYVSILPVDQGIEHSGGASFAKNPEYFDPGNIVQAGDRGRVQRRRLDVRRARRRRPQVRAQDPVHREDQPQRIAHLPEQVRPDHVRHRRAGRRHGRGRGGRDDLLRVGGKRPADRRSERGVRPGARTRSGHRAVVLPAQQRVQEGQGLPRQRRPDRPGEPPRRDHPGRHHQAEAAGEQSAATRR